MSNKQMKILVTGAAAGLGAELCRAINKAGHIAVEYDIKYGQDVRDPEDWLSQGDYDGLINCAGVNANAWFEEINRLEMRKVMEINAFSFVYMTQAILPALTRNNGFVINIVSNAAHIPMTSSLAYNASKAAALMITKQMAHELTPKHGITVFSVSPNKLEGTEMSKQIESAVCETRGWTPEFAAEYQKKALMHGRETSPVALAEFIVGLVTSGQWNYLSGCDIPFGK